ncbi:MAG: porin [Thiohalorhabdus sp.]|uniref:porin n=1 Tax=Thiohalorhabdus sp. TaxID=3094134 RepID=UPI003980B387
MPELANRAVPALLLAGVAAPASSPAGVTVYDKGDTHLEFGGRLQAQYHLESPDAGDSTDELFFRRMRLYMEGGVTEDISGKWQVDFGKAGVSVKDAYIAYTALGPGRLTVGNHYVPFSRESNTSSKRQQLVERTFVGDHNYGTPDRQLGLSYAGVTGPVGYQVGAYEAYIDADTKKLDFGSGTNKDDDWYGGKMVAGGLDFFLVGEPFKKAQGDFARAPSLALGINGFSWKNDDEQPAGTPAPAQQYDTAKGLSADVALRAGGLSVDAQYNRFATEANGSNVTSGLIEGGEGDFRTYAVEGGYMVVPSRAELVAGYQALDADAYDETWTRASAGLNFFLNGHTDKLQATYRVGSNREGVDGKDANELFVQFQHVI